MTPEINRIEVHDKDLILGIVPFKLHCCNPLFEFGDAQIYLTAYTEPVRCSISRKKIFRKLLCDRASPTRILPEE
jgi:hypothetical protein